MSPSAAAGYKHCVQGLGRDLDMNLREVKTPGGLTFRVVRTQGMPAGHMSVP